MSAFLWLVPALPGTAALALAVAGPRANRLAGPLVTALAAVEVGLAIWLLADRPRTHVGWLVAAGRDVEVGLRADGLGAVFALLVASISLAIFLYAARFLARDEGRHRFFALSALFLAAMLTLVLAADFLLLLVAWELVGFCSWALIGYWYEDPARPRAANRAFLVTRTADLGLYLAAFAALAATGTFAFEAVNDGRAEGALLAVVAGGAIAAAAGKSGQLPFSSWLFAAMEGPVPVSALLHSATMVAAGAYLLLRLSPALAATGWALPVVAIIGLATALAGPLVALAQDDLKRLLAASTSAQYGLVLVGIGAGGTAAATLLLVNHAVYKALLFLAVGVVMERAGSRRLSELGGLGRALPRTALVFAIGAAALAALPPLGGFFAKDDVLAAALEESRILYTLAFLAAAVSALYAAYAFAATFGGERGIPPVERSGSAGGLLAPPAFLAAAALGLAALSLGPLRERWEELFRGPAAAAPALWELALSAAVALALAALGLTLASRKLILARSSRLAPLREWLALDRLHDAVAMQPVLALAGWAAAADDRVVDRGVGLSSAAGRAFAAWAAAVDDRVVDRGVRTSAAAGRALASLSALGDVRFWDRLVVERLARSVRLGGAVCRLQTGALHRYYAFALVGVAGFVALLVAL